MVLVQENPPASTGDIRDPSLIPGLGIFPQRRAWQPAPVFLLGESHGQQSLAGYVGSQRVERNWSDLARMRVIQSDWCSSEVKFKHIGGHGGTAQRKVHVKVAFQKVAICKPRRKTLEETKPPDTLILTFIFYIHFKTKIFFVRNYRYSNRKVWVKYYTCVCVLVA